MILTGAQIIVETLIEQGCEVVFGYPGGFVLNIYDELYKNSRRIKHVNNRPRAGCRPRRRRLCQSVGQVGVVMATSGPGVTNLITGLAPPTLIHPPLWPLPATSP